MSFAGMWKSLRALKNVHEQSQTAAIKRQAQLHVELLESRIAPTGDLLFCSNSKLYEYTPAGSLVSTRDIPYPASNSGTEYPRGIVVDGNQDIQVYNGTFAPYLSTYHTATGTWEHHNYAGWSTVNNGSYGGIGVSGSYVFVTDMSTNGAAEIGIVRFNTQDWSAQRFATSHEYVKLTVGLDGLLYGLEGSGSGSNKIDVYDPNTLAFQRQIVASVNADYRGIAVNKSGDLFLASWESRIAHFDSHGTFIKDILNGSTYGLNSFNDLALGSDSTIVAGDRGNDILTTDESLTSLTKIAGPSGFGGFVGFGTSQQTLPNLSITGLPSSVTAGVATSLTVTALDISNNTNPNYRGTVHFTSTDSQAGLPTDYTFTAQDAGVHTFPLTLRTAGTPTVSVTGTNMSAAHATTTVAAAAVDHLQIVAPPVAAAGQSFSLTANALDAFGNVATTFVGKVHFSSSDAQATLPPDYTFTAQDAGSHTFSITLRGAGTQTITTSSAGLSAVQVSLSVSQSAADHLQLSLPSSIVPGTAVTATVTAMDAFGNPVSSYTGTVHFTSSDSQANLPADYTFTTQDAGTHSFSVTLRTSGSQTVTVSGSSSVSSLTMASQAGDYIGQGKSYSYLPSDGTFTVQRNFDNGVSLSFNSTNGTDWWYLDFAAAANATLVPGFYGNASRYPFQTTAQPGLDVSGEGRGSNQLTGNFTIITATYQADGTVIAFDAKFEQHSEGTPPALFGEIYYQTGSSSVTAGQATTTVGSASTVDHLQLSAAGSTTAGQALSLTVKALDSSGHVVPTFTGKVHFASSDTQAVLPSDYTFTPQDAGVHTFAPTLRTAGSQTLTVTSTGLPTAQITASVSAATIDHLQMTSPASPTAGQSWPITLKAIDAYGNQVPAFTGTVHFASSDTQATLPPDYPFTAQDAGSHTFILTMRTAGLQTMTVTSAGLAAIQAAPTVNPAIFDHLQMLTQTSATAGQSFDVSLKVLDAFGNVAAGYLGSVHFSTLDLRATLPSDYTFTSTDKGQVTFASGITLRTVGPIGLTVVDKANLSKIATGTVTVSPGSADHLGFVQQPTGQATNTVISPAISVRVLDAFGNLVDTDSRTITLFLSTNPSGGTLAGTLGVAAIKGVATFNNLSIDRAGVGYAVTATASGVATDVSAPFSITSTTIKPVQDLFVLGPNNQVYAQKLDANGQPASDYFLTQASAVKSFALGHDAAGRPVLFVIGGDNQVYEMKFDANGNPASPYLPTKQGFVQSLAVGNDPQGRPELFAVGLNQPFVFGLKFDDSDNSSAPYFLTQASAVKALSVGHDASGRPEIFVIGGDNQAYAMKFDAQGNPAGGYFLTGPGFVKSIVASNDASGRPVLFALGLNQPFVFGLSLDAQGSPTSGYYLTQGSAVKDFTVTRDAANKPQLFAIGMDSQVYTLKLDANARPASSYQLTQAGMVKAQSATTDSQGRFVLFVIGGDDQVYEQLFDATGQVRSPYVLTKPGRVLAVRVMP